MEVEGLTTVVTPFEVDKGSKGSVPLAAAVDSGDTLLQDKGVEVVHGRDIEILFQHNGPDCPPPLTGEIKMRPALLPLRFQAVTSWGKILLSRIGHATQSLVHEIQGEAHQYIGADGLRCRLVGGIGYATSGRGHRPSFHKIAVAVVRGASGSAKASTHKAKGEQPRHQAHLADFHCASFLSFPMIHHSPSTFKRCSFDLPAGIPCL